MTSRTALRLGRNDTAVGAAPVLEVLGKAYECLGQDSEQERPRPTERAVAACFRPG
jgi:hypothetical protein